MCICIFPRIFRRVEQSRNNRQQLCYASTVPFLIGYYFCIIAESNTAATIYNNFAMLQSKSRTAETIDNRLFYSVLPKSNKVVEADYSIAFL